MKKEQLLIKFKLNEILNFILIDNIVSICYNKTGKKFNVIFNGSKGYISNIEIRCECMQLEENRIFLTNYVNKNGSLKKINVNVFYSKDVGIRLSTGKDAPQVTHEYIKPLKPINDLILEDDLPF